MKLILFRSNNIFDSRVNKYHNYFERAGVDYTIVGWDRKCEGLEREKYEFFRYRAGEAVGGVKAVRNHFNWMRFVYRYLKRHQEVSTIHACDLNAAFPAALFKSWHKRDVTLVFDACDWYSANFSGYKLLRALFSRMERFTCKWADELIICEPERQAQIQFALKKTPLVLRNIPEIDRSAITGVQEKFKFENNNITLAYFGGLVANRFIMELLSLAEEGGFNLLLAGSGDSSIMQKCEELNNRDNVKYFGRLDMIDGLNMENAADVVYAMYCKVNPNHIYAAPNKYYEALLLGKPLITTRGTIVGDKTDRECTGWAVEEDLEEMRALINGMSKEEIEEKGNNATALWERCFKDELSNFFDNIYSRAINAESECNQ